MNRRNFIQSGAAASAAISFTQSVTAQDDEKVDDVNIALIGCGSQGRVLMNAMLKIPGVRFKAVGDIWNYAQRYGSRYLQKFGHKVNVYEDYKELLATETDIDAVVCAAPDFMHAPITVAALEAGKHVYCEKMMSNSLEGARSMVEAAKKSGKLCQIGHQRRSNPRYLHVYNNLIRNNKLFGRLMFANAQWNRGVSEPNGWPKSYVMDEATLNKYGYGSMHEFRNWRWFKKYGGGIIADLGAHQIDILNWFFGTNPSGVLASGGVDYYDEYELPDNYMTIFDYDTPEGESPCLLSGADHHLLPRIRRTLHGYRGHASAQRSSRAGTPSTVNPPLPSGKITERRDWCPSRQSRKKPSQRKSMCANRPPRKPGICR